MNASDPANSNKLTDEQLDALLESADHELLLHIQANTDPTATLTGLMAAPVNPEERRADPPHADPASKPGHPVRTRRTWSHRRSWSTIAAAGAVASAAAVVAALALARTTHQPTSAASHPAVSSSMSIAKQVIDATERPIIIYFPRHGSGTVTVYIPFSPGQSELGKSAAYQLSMLLQAVRPYTSGVVAITITGYANDLRRPASAGNLSGMRVQAVRNWLIAHHVPACKLRIVDRGAPGTGHRANASTSQNVIITIWYVGPAHATQSVTPSHSCEWQVNSPA
jgi:outer membrane protein OmpA-like peptidoglycan-associated protein